MDKQLYIFKSNTFLKYVNGNKIVFCWNKYSISYRVLNKDNIGGLSIEATWPKLHTSVQTLENIGVNKIFTCTEGAGCIEKCCNTLPVMGM